MLGLGLGFTSPAVLGGGAAVGGALGGGAALLVDEANGFAADFTYDADATKRVAVKASSVVTEYAVDSFFSNAGTSPKQVWTAAGALVWSPHNMCLQSQAFEQATPWNPTTSVTVVANAINAPDGTLTADRLVETALNNNHQLIHANIAQIASATYTFSCYAKAGERDWLTLAPSNLTPADWFDLTNGVVGTSANGGVITSVGGGWYRCSITYVFSGSPGGPNLFIRTANGQTVGYLGDVTKGLYVWGAQLVRGSTPGAYLPTTAAARFGLALDYDPVTHAAKGLLCEPAATNLFPRGSEFDHATWTKGASTITANAVAAPSGAMEGDAFIPAAGSNNTYISLSAATTAATAYTYSLYIRNGTLGNNWAEMAIISTTNWRAWFNLATGVKGTSASSPTSYNITSVGGGWYRIDLTVTVGATTTTCYLSARSADGSTAALTGDGVSPAYYLWGAQFETGTLATSLILTYAASVTRAVDQYNVAPASIGHSATAGTWWIENILNTSPAGANRLLAFTSAAAPFIHNVTTYGVIDGTTLSKATGSALTGVVHKVSSAYQSGDRAITVDGLAPATDAGVTTNLLAPGALIYFGCAAAGASPSNGTLRKTTYVPRRMSNAEMVTKTT